MEISPTSDQLAEQMESMLMSPAYRHGEKLLPERALAEQFGVGRPLVREVLRRLQERGLITVVPGRGTFVRQPALTESGGSVDAIAKRGQITPRQLIAARSMLESFAAFLAAQNRTEVDLERMRELLVAVESASSVSDVVRADVAFHEAVAIASNNPVIQIMFGSIRNLVEGIVIRSVSDAAVRHEGVPFHRTVFSAIEERNPEAARSAMLAHLDVAQRLYGEDLDRPLSEVVGSSVRPGLNFGLSAADLSSAH
ncbi:FadR/GntR family transcriptional regulator [Diaminobutyricibacter sp. McL0618]|uniref:FadR/GntR family transcriptional regulator n=1 Tax=Leifsonia sp. McL0618 TaxID=3415677 RepID=UPI003CF36AE4